MSGNALRPRVDLIGRSCALLYLGVLSGCSSWVPASATPENQTVLYGEFYKANLGDDPERADTLARQLELCGRQLYLKDKGFFTALSQQDEHGEGTSIAEIVDLFTEDACAVTDLAPPVNSGDGAAPDGAGPGSLAPDLSESEAAEPAPAPDPDPARPGPGG